MGSAEGDRELVDELERAERRDADERLDRDDLGERVDGLREKEKCEDGRDEIEERSVERENARRRFVEWRPRERPRSRQEAGLEIVIKQLQ